MADAIAARARKNKVRKDIVILQEELLHEIEENALNTNDATTRFKEIEALYQQYVTSSEEFGRYLEAYGELEALIRLQTEQKRLFDRMTEADDASDAYIKQRANRTSTDGDAGMGEECDEEREEKKEENEDSSVMTTVKEAAEELRDTVLKVDLLQAKLRSLQLTVDPEAEAESRRHTGNPMLRKILFKPDAYSTPREDDEVRPREPRRLVSFRTGGEKEDNIPEPPRRQREYEREEEENYRRRWTDHPQNRREERDLQAKRETDQHYTPTSGRWRESGPGVSDIWSASGGRQEKEQAPTRSRHDTMPSQRHLEYGGYPGESQDYTTREAPSMLERIRVPEFSGERHNFEAWWTEFMGLVHGAMIPVQQKMMRLRRVLTGNAATAVQGLGDSAFSYETALDILWEKYGGRRRQMTMRMDDVKKLKVIKDGNAADLERLMEVLNVLMVRLKEDGRESELGFSTLYSLLQEKIEAPMLRRYFGWLRNHGYDESVITLRQFMSEETRNTVYAQEITRGIQQEKPKREFKSRTLHTAVNESLGGARPRYSCKMCKEAHGIWRCPKFKELSTKDRWGKATEFFLCFRCLGEQHKGALCKFSRKCGVQGCLNTHHHLLHDSKGSYQPKTENRDGGNPSKEFPKKEETPERNKKPSDQTELKKPAAGKDKGKSDTTCHLAADNMYVALRTVPVVLHGAKKSITVHALLDDASTKTYINREVADELGLASEDIQLNVKVLNNMSTVLNSSAVNLKIQSLDGKFQDDVLAYTTDDVTGEMTVVNWNEYKYRWAHLEHVEFPKVGRKQKIDMLLGANCVDAHTPLELVTGPRGTPQARLTPLGWTCVGAIPLDLIPRPTFFTFHQRVEDETESMMRKLWEFDEPEACTVVRPEDKHAMNVARDTLSYDGERYTIGIPWKVNTETLPDNYDMAYSRLQSTERKLLKNEKLATAYRDVINGYVKKGYIRKVDQDDEEEEPTGNLLAHFAVYKEDRATTKCRVVFDGSAKTKGISINDIICQGPKLQADLVTILYRFRRKLIAVTCDISEMYLQVRLMKKDRRFHRFLWRDMNTKARAELFESLSWMFGINASPFAIQFTAKQNAEKNKEIYPLAAEVIDKGTYMDDSLASVDTVPEGEELYQQMVALWEKAHMSPGKWVSNSEELLQKIPGGRRNVCVDLESGKIGTTKTLGVVWDPEADVFTYRVEKLCGMVPCTKRGFLSGTAMLFDPLGLIAPVIATARIILQRMWMSGITWDEMLPGDLQEAVDRWFDDLPDLQQITIPRACKEPGEVVEVQLHTFCDASIDAYGAMLYLKNVYEDGSVSIHLLRAKTKVAPVTSTSVPRLELMAAVVGVRLAAHAQKELEIPSAHCYHWSDSADTLYWICGQSRKFRPFVANRVGEIQRLSAPSSWAHVATHDNPADILSRGCTPRELKDSLLWWNGPSFLLKPAEEWPKTGPKIVVQTKYEEKKDITMVTRSTATGCSNPKFMNGKMRDIRLHPDEHSSWRRMTHICAYVLRFLDNCRSKKEQSKRGIGPLIPEEVCDAENVYFQLAQRDQFVKEWTLIQKGQEVNPDSKLAKLSPFADEFGTIRVGGRLEASDCINYEAKHPIVLPRYHAVTALIVRQAHHDAGHAGTNKTLTHLTQRYWVIAGRKAIRSWETQCMACRRRNKRPFAQKMGVLPAARITESLRPFDYSSVDYAGPFLTRQGRGRIKAKRYLCVFACMTTRAVHLELSYSMDTSSFLNALTRMVSRRGAPREIVSDNGSNFVGATRELRELVKELDQDRIQHETVDKGIHWKFNPPSAPHFNGVHEAIVKSAKRALKVILEDADVTDEELHTAICGAEALLNARPLTYQSADPLDNTPLTPNDFLVGRVCAEFPPVNADDPNCNLRNRWRHVQRILTHFWQRWQRELLPTLNPRGKWCQDRRNVREGEIVMVLSPENPRGKWPLARVIEIYPGRDGRVRAVDIKMGNAIYRRPIVKLCPLEEING